MNMPPSPKKAQEQIEKFIESLALEFDGRPMVTRNRDNSVDGEVLIRLGEKEKVANKIIDVQEYTRKHHLIAKLPDKAYVSIGLRWEPSGRNVRKPAGARGKKPHSPEIDSVSGMGQLYTSYYDKRSMPTADAVAAGISDTLKRKRYAKRFEQVLIRIHWNPRGKQPPRPRKGKR
jgi:hypothetical protein